MFLEFSVNSIARIHCLYTATLLLPQLTCTHVTITCLDRSKQLFQDCWLYQCSVELLYSASENISLVFEF